MEILATNLGLREDYLLEAFGGDEELGAACVLTIIQNAPNPTAPWGLSSHSDPDGMTVLYSDENVSRLQVRRGDVWITVKPVPKAFIVNIGDKLQVLSNANYKSVEHRVIVNSAKERVSLAFLYNPKGDVVIKPAEEFVTEQQPPRYFTTTYNEYRLYIGMKGPCGKSKVESLKSNSR